jgi:catechol 2,3-dioxygenase-like lactoylglutathione lyase family enzyme
MPEAQQMLDQIVYTAVFVTDQERALDFYTNVLGLEQRVDNPTPDGLRFLTVGVRGQDFQLVLWPGRPGRPSRRRAASRRRTPSRRRTAGRRTRS